MTKHPHYFSKPLPFKKEEKGQVGRLERPYAAVSLETHNCLSEARAPGFFSEGKLWGVGNN